MATSAGMAAMAARSLGGAMCRLSAPLRCLDGTMRGSARRAAIGSAGGWMNSKEELVTRPGGVALSAVDSSRSLHRRLWRRLSTTATSAGGSVDGAGGGEGDSLAYREKEREITLKLQQALNAEKVVVEDASGGCGTMYNIYVKSSRFSGKSLIQQHRMVTEALEADVKVWHGLTVRTAVPSTASPSETKPAS